MTTEYILYFECCGNYINLGYTKEEGSHGDFCLACGTENPETRVEAKK